MGIFSLFSCSSSSSGGKSLFLSSRLPSIILGFSTTWVDRRERSGLGLVGSGVQEKLLSEQLESDCPSSLSFDGVNRQVKGFLSADGVKTVGFSFVIVDDTTCEDVDSVGFFETVVDAATWVISLRRGLCVFGMCLGENSTFDILV